MTSTVPSANAQTLSSSVTRRGSECLHEPIQSTGAEAGIIPFMPVVRSMAALGLLVAVFLLLAGCAANSPETDPPGDAEEGISKEVTRGPVTVRIRLDKREMTIAERLQLTLEVEAAEIYEVELPKVGDKLEQFGIVDYNTSQPELVDDGTVRTVRSYTLEPFLSGRYTIPPMKVVFRKKGEKEKDDHEVETEKITVTVKSLLPEEAGKLDVEDIIGPQNMPPPALAPLWWSLGGGLFILSAALLAVRAWRRRAAPVAAALTIPAHEIAYAELKELVAQDLVGQGLLKPFYQRVSDILRRYIENRFGLHAPERTTEEFLHELQLAESLDKEQKRLLEAFLTHCDLVKFAAHEPSAENIQNTFDTCRDFIEQTKEAA